MLLSESTLASAPFPTHLNKITSSVDRAWRDERSSLVSMSRHWRGTWTDSHAAFLVHTSSLWFTSGLHVSHFQSLETLPPGWV